MSKPLKTLQFPDLDETYTIPYAVNASGTVQNGSTAVATAAWVTSLSQTMNGLPTIHCGTTDPAASLGKNGDIYIKYS